MTKPIADVLGKLNGYDGDNIWQDLILRDIDGYDEAATEALDPHGYSDRFVAAGATYRLGADGSWAVA